MMVIFILDYVLSKGDGERIMAPNASFKDDIVLLILKVEK